MTRVSRALDRFEVSFDDPNLVAKAGLLLTATLSDRLGLEALIDDTVKLGGRVGGARPGRKVLTLTHAMIAGGTHIDHADMLRAGSTAGVLGHRVMAPSTLGTFLRSFTFGHVRQLEAVNGRALERAWAAGIKPAVGLVIDIDSTICEVFGKHKQCAGYGYTRKLGYHPLLATRADTGEVLHARMRKGSANTQRGARRFIDELVARTRRAGATNALTIRFDSGFWSGDMILALNRLNVRYTMAVRCSSKGINNAITQIPDDAWIPIAYTDDGEAEVAECDYTTGSGNEKVTRRLVVRRTRLTDKHQLKLWPDWRHFGFLTDLDWTAVELDKFHRQHAVVELAIRDLKEGAGLEHIPSGSFHANGAWLQCAVLAHNMIRWTAIAGKGPRRQPTRRRPHTAHPTPRDPRPTPQPIRPTDTADADQLAMGNIVHHSTQHAARTEARHRLNASPADRRAAPEHQALTTNKSTTTNFTTPQNASATSPRPNQPSVNTRPTPNAPVGGGTVGISV